MDTGSTLRFSSIAGLAMALAACATAHDPNAPDAEAVVIVDSRPGTPDARLSLVDAPLGSPDAPPGSPDAMVSPPDAMPPPDAMSVDVIQQLLSNENLDLGSGGGWVENGAGYPIILSPSDPTYPLPVTPQSGNYAGWLGGVDGATRALYQTVTIPANATNMSVTGFRYIATEETSGVWDTFTITLRNSGGSVLETLANLSNANSSATWVSFTHAPITNLAGQTIRLQFESVQDSFYNTNFFIDSLALRVTVCQ